MLNANKLKGKIIERGFTISELAEILNIDKSTLYRRLGGGSAHLTIREADKIVETLSLSSEEAGAIFFSQFVA